MQAMILAAGRGQRMRHLTEATPKPLLKVRGEPLIDYHLKALSAAGFKKVLVNYAYLGEQIVSHIGDGRRYGIQVEFSPEEPGGLETGGGIFRALPLLFDSESSDDRLLIVNADVFTDLDFTQLLDVLAPDDLAHLVLVDNPAFHLAGDFSLDEKGRVHNLKASDKKFALTYSGVAVLRCALFEHCSDGIFPLAPLLRCAADQGKVSGRRFPGLWSDVGTPERLNDLNERLK